MRYLEFINSIDKSRDLGDTYTELHHIIPRCLGGKDEENNLIRLTLEEHFIAHELLYNENPENDGIFLAYWRMCTNKSLPTPSDYASIRGKFIEYMRGREITPEHRKNLSESHKGLKYPNRKKISEESRKRMSDSHKGLQVGELNPNYGNHSPLKDTTRLKISASLIGHSVSDETRLKISLSKRGKELSAESRENMSKGQIGKKYSPRIYHLLCKCCNGDFLGNSPAQKYCNACKERSYE